MEKIFIVCIDDQREVLNAIASDLAFFEKELTIEICESASEAWEVIDEIDSEGNYLGMVISDHVMPGKNGVEFLIEINSDRRFANTKKILLTGLATHKDTISAINKARVDAYIEKPWQKVELIQKSKELITQFVLDAGLEYQKFSEILDQATLLEGLRHKV
ncbi:MAG: response regulator [Cyclobacteriaceae bacterium]